MLSTIGSRTKEKTMLRCLPLLFLAFLFVCLPLLANPAHAQTGFITGIVQDIEDNPVMGATVTAESAQWSRTEETVTDGRGQFSLIGLPAGRWLFVVQASGYQPTQGLANIHQRGNSGRIHFVMEADPLNPPAPSTGLLAGFTGAEIQSNLDAADYLFDNGDYTGAIKAYAAMLAQLPELTSLHLQIGHAHQERLEFDKALTAYRAVPVGDPPGAEAAAAIETLEFIRREVPR